MLLLLLLSDSMREIRRLLPLADWTIGVMALLRDLTLRAPIYLETCKPPLGS